MSRLEIWFKELRAEFLTASVAPILLGAAIAYARDGVFNALLFALTLASMVCLHIAANVSNDYFDHRSGNDTLNTQLVRPFSGGSRMIEDGFISARDVLIIAIVFWAAAIAIGAALIAMRGPVVLLFGVVGLLCGFFYVAPPVYFAKRGLGELVVGLNFGLLPIIGTYYVLTGGISRESIVAGLPLTGLMAAMLFINEFPDMNADARVGKRTLVVRMGRPKASRFYAVLTLVSYVPIIAGVAAGLMPRATLIALIPIIFILKAIDTARKHCNDPKKLAPANALTILSHLLTGLLLAAGYLMAGALG
jgi:1,4-dihydroxy-2-naphthoate octaprenyltransferase